MIENNNTEVFKVGIVTDLLYGARISPSLEYEFQNLNGTIVEGRSFIPNELLEIGNDAIRDSLYNKRVIIRYFAGHSEINDLIFFTSVPDSVVAPKEGWSEFPCDLVNGKGKDYYCK